MQTLHRRRAIENRHHHVRDHEIHVSLPTRDDRECLGSLARSQHSIVVLFEDRASDITERVLIIDHQDAFTLSVAIGAE